MRTISEDNNESINLYIYLSIRRLKVILDRFSLTVADMLQSLSTVTAATLASLLLDTFCFF